MQNNHIWSHSVQPAPGPALIHILICLPIYDHKLDNKNEATQHYYMKMEKIDCRITIFGVIQYSQPPAPALVHILIYLPIYDHKSDNKNKATQHYGKCSKMSKSSCLPKRPRQTVQTQIRLLLKKQSDQGLPCLLFWQAFVSFTAEKQHFI